MKFHTNDTTSAVIIKELMRRPDSTTAEIQTALRNKYSRQVINQTIRRLRKRKHVHISGYEYRRNGSPTRKWSVGSEPDEQRLHWHPEAVKQRRREQVRNNTRRYRTRKATAQGGAMAAMVAQAGWIKKG